MGIRSLLRSPRAAPLVSTERRNASMWLTTFDGSRSTGCLDFLAVALNVTDVTALLDRRPLAPAVIFSSCTCDVRHTLRAVFCMCL